jgi:hypothetical protein
MTQFDAGPGDWSDREWDDPNRKQKPQARPRRITLPPWALLAIIIGAIILLCVGLVLVVRAIRQDRDATATPAATMTDGTRATATALLISPTTSVTPTNTVALPAEGTGESPAFTEIAPGAKVVVHRTLGAGLNLRAEASTNARRIGNVKDGAILTVLEGPETQGGYVWWLLEAPDGTVGWGAGNWLELNTE